MNSGVVARGQPFVAEIAVDLVDLLEAAHHQPLQVQLRRDAQVHLHVQRVVMRDERPCRRAARNGLHHGCFHFHETPAIELLAHPADELRACHEHRSGLFIDDEVDIPLAGYRVSVSARPCHLSGSGRSDLVSSRSAVTFTDNSPVRVRNNVPAAPMVSPTSQPLNCS